MARTKKAPAVYSAWVVSEHRRQLKLRAVAYKGGACQKCGYAKCAAVLQFHHTDPTKKDFQLGGRALAWARVAEELDKTLLVCANCHAEIHAAEYEPRRIQMEAEARALVPKRAPYTHGNSGYTLGCRCDVCKAGKAQRTREYRDQKRRRDAAA